MATKDFVFKIKADSTSFQKGVDTTKESLAALKKEQDDLARDGKAAFDKTRTAAERYAAEVAKLKAQLKGGAIDQQTFSRGVSQARGEMIKSRAESMGLSSSLMSLANPAGLAAAALGALAMGAKASYDAFKNLEAVDKDLALVLGNVGRSIESVSGSLASIANQAGVSTTELKGVFSELVHASGNVAQSERDLALAYDLAAKAGVPAIEAAKAINEARKGNIGALYQLKLLSAQELKDLEAIEDPALRAAKAIETLRKENEGLAAEAAKNRGQFTDLSNDLGTFSESLGAATVKVGDFVAGGFKLTPLFLGFTSGIQGWNKAFDLLSVKLGWATIQAKEFETQIIKIDGAIQKSNLLTMAGSAERLAQEKALLETKKAEAALKKQADAAAFSASAKLKADEEARSEIRSEMLRLDLDLLAQTTEIDREKTRLLKEEFQIKNSITDATERGLALDLARERSAIKIHDIEVKLRRDADKLIEDSDKERLARAKALEDERSKLAAKQLEDADKIRKDQMQKAQADAKALGDSLYSAIEQSFIDPFEQGVEGIMKSLLKNLAIAGGKKLLESGISAISGTPGFASGGYTGSGNPSAVAGVVHRNEMVMESPIVRGQESDWAQLRSMVQQGTPVRDIIAGPTSVDGTITIINNVDNEAAGFIRSSAGQSAIMNTINRNAPAIRRILRS